jgi:hypothetical protein
MVSYNHIVLEYCVPQDPMSLYVAILRTELLVTLRSVYLDGNDTGLMTLYV